MEFDDNGVCEKIINEIDAVFQKDNELFSFEIIPMPSNLNKSPVIVALEHNLGLESWCVTHVYEHSHRKILDNKCLSNKHISNENFLKYINCAILINPDVSLFWNIRRKLVEKNKLNLTKEFQFSSIVLNRKPKSAESFSYRRWLFSFQSSESIDWTFDLRLSEKCADRTRSNYHAWTHRQWVLQNEINLLKFEFHVTEKFIRKHITDYSCYYHRQFVLSKMFEYRIYDEDVVKYSYLINFINTQSNLLVDNAIDLIKIILPDINHNLINEISLKSFLFCLNQASYDIKMCLELKEMYGNREAFENHRRSIVKFMVDSCRSINSITEDQPLTKLTKFDEKPNLFLNLIKEIEEKSGEKNKNWSRVFLGFD